MDGLKESLSNFSALDKTFPRELGTPLLALVRRGENVFRTAHALTPPGVARSVA
jgi:hypothetical protein